MSVRSRFAILVAAVAWTVPAAAQVTKSDVAEALFEEGRRLFGEGSYEAACAKLGESQRLEPAGGTLLNLALCHEKEGKLATAWREFKDAEAQAVRDGRLDRQTEARDHVTTLEPRLSRLAVVLAEVAPGIEVRLDGVVISTEAFSLPLPIDPGRHHIEARAPARNGWSLDLMVGEAEVHRAVVPSLDGPPSSDVHARHASRMSATPWVVGGVGVLAIGIGAVFGLRAVSKHDESGCGSSSCPDAHAAGINDDARRFAWVADIGIGIGALIVAGYLFFRDDHGRRAAP